MNEVGQAFLEVVLAILSLGTFFFAYALLDKLLRPRLLPASVSPLDNRDSTARMVAAFAFYVVVPNLTLVGGIACIVVADDLHFIVKDVLIGAVAASLAVTILVFYGAMGARKEASDAEILERRRQMQADLVRFVLSFRFRSDKNYAN